MAGQSVHAAGGRPRLGGELERGFIFRTGRGCGSIPPPERSAGIIGAVDMNIAFDIIGDANGDGKVDLKDVSAVVRHAAGWKVSLDEIQADLDGDGYVTLKDAAKLIRLISGR